MTPSPAPHPPGPRRVLLGILLSMAAGTALTATRPPAERAAPAGPDGPLLERDRVPGDPAAGGVPVPVTLLPTGGSRVTAVAFAPAGDRIAAGTADGSLFLCDGRGRALHEAELPRFVRALAFSPDGTRVLLATGAAEGIVYDPVAGTRTLLEGHERFLGAADWSADGSRLLTASFDGTARTWTAAGAAVGVLRGHGAVVDAAAFSPDGRTVLTVGGDGTARTWRPDGTPLAVLGAPGEIRTASWIAGGRVLALGTRGGARILDPAGGAAVALIAPGPIACAASDPETGRIYTGGASGEGRLHGPDGAPGPVLRGHAGTVAAALFLPREGGLLTLSVDGTVRAWDREGGLRSIGRGKPAWIHRALLSPDGERVLVLFKSEFRRPPWLLEVRDLLGR